MRIISRGLILFVTLSTGAALAQTIPPVPDAATLAARAARRFPQPVRVGDLIGHDVLEPIEAQPVLGHVIAVARRGDGGLDVIIRLGDVLGLGGRLIAVPADAVALLGNNVAVLDYTPDQLAALPTAAAPAAALAPEDIIRVGLTKPFH